MLIATEVDKVLAREGHLAKTRSQFILALSKVADPDIWVSKTDIQDIKSNDARIASWTRKIFGDRSG